MVFVYFIYTTLAATATMSFLRGLRLPVADRSKTDIKAQVEVLVVASQSGPCSQSQPTEAVNQFSWLRLTIRVLHYKKRAGHC